MTTRALIVEDEPIARRALQGFIRDIPWLQLVGEAVDGREAVRLIHEREPDLVFLDVQLPEMTGLEVLERIQLDPAVVFTTAYDKYAVAAFEFEAIDYLIKPFGEARFRETLERVRRRLAATGAPGEASRDRARVAFGGGPLTRLFARRGNDIVPVPLAEVSHIDAADDYANVHRRGETYLVHVSLGELASRLDPERFLRIHRSHIVNLDEVAAIQEHGDRRLVVILRDGQQRVASRSGSQELRARGV